MADDDQTAEVECPHCFGPVHPDATRCRHCGGQLVLPWWHTSWGTLLIGAAIGLVVVVVVFNKTQDDREKRAEECIEAIGTVDECD